MTTWECDSCSKELTVMEGEFVTPRPWHHTGFMCHDCIQAADEHERGIDYQEDRWNEQMESGK